MALRERPHYLASMTLNDRSSALALLSTRRSGKPRDMVAPGPGEAELAQMLAVASRVPDHGKLAPWRFVVIHDRGRFADLLESCWRAENGAGEGVDLSKVRAFAHDAPVLVAVLSVPVVPHKIPLWEQEMSAGAACLNLLHAGHALGYVGSWLTGWAAYSPGVYTGLGGEPGGRVAGFLFFGTPACPPEERPRPPLEGIARHWGA